MGAETVVDKVRAIAQRVAGGYGLEIFDVQFRREAPGMVLRVQIDRPGPASVEDVVPTAYTLEVSSPGLDRPLRQLDDYRRFTGRLAKIVVREKVDGQGFFRGKIAGVEGRDVLIDADDRRTHRVPLDVISRANLEVEF